MAHQKVALEVASCHEVQDVVGPDEVEFSITVVQLHM
jgi:hypothetical protein